MPYTNYELAELMLNAYCLGLEECGKIPDKENVLSFITYVSDDYRIELEKEDIKKNFIKSKSFYLRIIYIFITKN